MPKPESIDLLCSHENIVAYRDVLIIIINATSVCVCKPNFSTCAVVHDDTLYLRHFFLSAAKMFAVYERGSAIFLTIMRLQVVHFNPILDKSNYQLMFVSFRAIIENYVKLAEAAVSCQSLSMDRTRAVIADEAGEVVLTG